MHSDTAPPQLRQVLLEVDTIKRFGASQGLEFSGNYREYVELDGPAVVWSVTACPPLAFEPVTWSFPVVGSVPYLGWFDRDDADRFARDIQEAGLDVAVRPVGAYSTLGFFNDPLLSTMIVPGPAGFGSLANVILHESVHATVYVDGQSVFNESLASFVADRMTLQFLRQRFGPRRVELRAYEELEARYTERRRMMAETLETLRALYASPMRPHDKLLRKRHLLVGLQAELESPNEINNATLMEFRTYRAGEGALQQLFDACGQDWPRFFDALLDVERDDFEDDQQEDLTPILAPLIASGCRPGNGRR